MCAQACVSGTSRVLGQQSQTGEVAVETIQTAEMPVGYPPVIQSCNATLARNTGWAI